jgi:TetR/AcrR family transcriptional regulator, transcriptional repressor for nem operon
LHHSVQNGYVTGMARPREFDEQRAIDKAMYAFWSTGYAATSTQQLCEATGLGRSSIYNTFHSKHDLFRKSLRHYDEITAKSRSELLERDGSQREKLRDLLMDMIEDELTHDRRGCLAINTTVELGPRDPELMGELRRDFGRFVAELQAVIEAGQRAGEIDETKNARALAEFVHATIGGIRLKSRSGADRATLESIVDVALSGL